MGLRMSAPKYHINTVMDFLAVPPERRPDCLNDFYLWLRLVETSSRLVRDLPIEIDPEFVWIDDDKNEITVAIDDKEITKFQMMRGADE